VVHAQVPEVGGQLGELAQVRMLLLERVDGQPQAQRIAANAFDNLEGNLLPTNAKG